MLAGALLYMYNEFHVLNGSFILPLGEVIESLHLEIAFVGFFYFYYRPNFHEGVI